MDGTPADPPDPAPPPRLPRRALLSVGVLAVAALVGATAVHRALSSASAGPAPSSQHVPANVPVDPEQVIALCPHQSCIAVALDADRARRYLAQLELQPATFAGARVITPDGTLLGELGQEDLGHGVTVTVSAVRAAPARPAPVSVYPPPGDPRSVITVADERDGWVLTAQLSVGDDGTAPVGQARHWLRTCALPDVAG